MGKEIVAEEDGLIIEDDFEETSENRQHHNRYRLKESEVLLSVKLVHSCETDHLIVPESEAGKLIRSKYIIADARYGKDLCQILGRVTQREVSLKNTVKLVRIATEKDLEKYEKNRGPEQEAYTFCRKKIADLKLDMKLISAHYLTDESKLMFFYSAENRVDFRGLLKELVSAFRERIELRQVGVRDESRIVGGLAVCGRPFCCAAVSDKLNAVSIKMAKEQNMSLNAMKISGPCGRLLCCLAYENDFYKTEKKLFPKKETPVRAGDQMYKVGEISLLKHQVQLIGEGGETVWVPLKKLKYNEFKKRWKADLE